MKTISEFLAEAKKMNRKEALKLDKDFYAEEENEEWYVFGDNSGFAYSSHNSEAEANKAAKNMKKKVKK